MRKVLEIISHTDFIWTSNVLDYTDGGFEAEYSACQDLLFRWLESAGQLCKQVN